MIYSNHSFSNIYNTRRILLFYRPKQFRTLLKLPGLARLFYYDDGTLNTQNPSTNEDSVPCVP